MRLSEKIGKIKLPARASAHYLMASTVGKITSFLVIPFSTRLMTDEEYGRLSLYMVILSGTTVICSAFSSGSAVYKGIRDHESNKSGYIKSVLLTTMSFSAIICILLFALSPFFDLTPSLLIPLSLQIICDGIIAVAMSSRKFYYQYKGVVAVALTSAVLPPSLSIIILKLWGGGYYARIYSLLSVSICLAIWCLVKILSTDEKISGCDLKYVIKASLPLLPHTASNALFVQADKLIISSVMGAAALAKYSVVYSLGMAMQFTVTAIGSALSPWLIRRLEVGEEDRIRRLIYPMTLGYFALAVCLIAIGPEAVAILGPPEYSEALTALVPIALSTPFYFLSTVATVGLIQSGRGLYTAVISLVNAALCIILSYTVIPLMGFLGAGVVLLVCHSVSAMLSVYLLKKATSKRLIVSKMIALPFLVSGTVGLLIYGLRDSIGARVALLCLPAIILIYCLITVSSLVIEKDGKAPS